MRFYSPLSSKLNEESGVREFNDEMNNGISYTDEVGLEEWIEYYKTEFGIIDGCYHNEGRSNTINHVIKDLCDLRKKSKQDNTAQLVIKLLANPMYCKSVFKPVETDTTVKDNRDDFEKHTSYNYNYTGSVI